MAIDLANLDPAASVGIAILAKAPIAGLAKTRLIPCLGEQGAAALQAWMLRRTVDTALSAGLGPVTLWCTPEIGHPAFQEIARSPYVQLRQQPDGDLGARMGLPMAESDTPGGTLIIGTDCPVISAADLRHAAGALFCHDAVVAPAEDGGYVLIGARKNAPALFSGIDWSTPRVMEQTRQSLRSLDWQHVEIGLFWDIDEESDYFRLAALFPEALLFSGKR